jgi:WD40 repeat protein
VQQLATTSADKTVKLWNLDGFTLDRTLTGHTRWVWDCVFSVDAAYLVTASSDATARLWDLSSGACTRALAGAAGGWGRVPGGWWRLGRAGAARGGGMQQGLTPHVPAMPVLQESPSGRTAGITRRSCAVR